MGIDVGAKEIYFSCNGELLNKPDMVLSAFLMHSVQENIKGGLTVGDPRSKKSFETNNAGVYEGKQSALSLTNSKSFHLLKW